MKMWKIAAIAMLALVPTAFGVTLDIANADGTKTHGPVAAGGTFTVNVNLDGTGAVVNGVSYYVQSDAAGKLQLTGRTVTSTKLTDVTTTNSTLTSSANGTLGPKNAKDIGATAPDLDTNVTGKETLMTLTFTALAALPVNPAAPVKIWITGASYNDPEFNQPAIADSAAYVITPEPVSALLLALGGLFLARRRA